MSHHPHRKHADGILWTKACTVMVTHMWIGKQLCVHQVTMTGSLLTTPCHRCVFRHLGAHIHVWVCVCFSIFISCCLDDILCVCNKNGGWSLVFTSSPSWNPYQTWFSKHKTNSIMFDRGFICKTNSLRCSLFFGIVFEMKSLSNLIFKMEIKRNQV